MHLGKLQRPVDKRGLGLPKLVFYHYAYGLRHLAQWALPPERAPPWQPIEQSAAGPLPLIKSLATGVRKDIKHHPVISHIQDVWKKVLKILNVNP